MLVFKLVADSIQLRRMFVYHTLSSAEAGVDAQVVKLAWHDHQQVH